VKIAGARNYVLTGVGAMLHEAVLRLAFEMMVRRGFTPLTVPVLVNDALMEGTGFFPLHREEVYVVERDEKSLVGTAEVPVTGLHADEILPLSELPKRYIARSPCFRREAGAAGRDTHGLYRIHYFEKLELVVLCSADAAESTRWHNEILSCAEQLLQALEMPYRVVEVCTGDMGQSKVRQYDVETWMPSREMYSETHSASRYHDFQARRLKLRYRDENGKPQVCHTLNSTVVASPRILIPLLELNQNADGSVNIPAALRKYVNGVERIA
jgi:seryl-tRNA synthetase